MVFDETLVNSKYNQSTLKHPETFLKPLVFQTLLSQSINCLTGYFHHTLRPVRTQKCCIKHHAVRSTLTDFAAVVIELFGTCVFFSLVKMSCNHQKPVVKPSCLLLLSSVMRRPQTSDQVFDTQNKPVIDKTAPWNRVYETKQTL